jgi:hypothetical protein
MKSPERRMATHEGAISPAKVKIILIRPPKTLTPGPPGSFGFHGVRVKGPPEKAGKPSSHNQFE